MRRIIPVVALAVAGGIAFYMYMRSRKEVSAKANIQGEEPQDGAAGMPSDIPAEASLSELGQALADAEASILKMTDADIEASMIASGIPAEDRATVKQSWIAQAITGADRRTDAYEKALLISDPVEQERRIEAIISAAEESAKRFQGTYPYRPDIEDYSFEADDPTVTIGSRFGRLTY